MRVMIYITSVQLAGQNHVVIYVGSRRVGTMGLTDTELSQFLDRFPPDYLVRSFDEVLDVLSHA